MSRQSLSGMHENGFTIVELIIVVVVIAILVAIVLVGYGGANNEALQKSLQNDLIQAGSAIESQKNFSSSSSTTWSPTGFPSNTNVSSGNVLQLVANPTDSTKYCINGFRTSPPTVMSFRSGQTGVYNGLCPGAATQQIGTTLGGSVPTIPRNVNLAQPLSEWNLTSGSISYDSTNNQLVLTPGASGVYTSPLIRVDNATNITISFSTYATQASSSFTPQSGGYTGMAYYAADGVTPVMNSINYANNGDARAVSLNNWATYTHAYPGGPNVVYVRATIDSGTYTSDNKIKNIQISASN